MYMQSISYLSLSSIHSILLLMNKRKHEIDIATIHTHNEYRVYANKMQDLISARKFTF